MTSKFDTQLLLSRPYLTKRQLQRLQKDNIADRRTYNQKTLAVIKFISEICVQLNFPRRTLETAIYFYQRYHVFNRFETEQCYTVATSSLLLSCKQVETIKKVNEICSVSLRLRNVPKASGDMIDNFKKGVFQIELRILEACSFDYRINNFVHIDEYVVKFGKLLSLDYRLCMLAWVIAYDVLKLETLLKVPQHAIALAVLKIAYQLLSPEGDWLRIVREKKLEIDDYSLNEAYFDIVNFYINSFDICDLKGNQPDGTNPLGLQDFINLKKIAGPESGLQDFSESDIELDPYFTSQRDYSVRERRYVLSPQLVMDEAASMQKKS
ncbi:CTK2 (YJL006C) [Zygosaccharomyces parabailii]|uniref:BN860_09384g1_1 n=1 Tax=Zygosaccharomyces bailii (strain CLIB 213 / ATCC 58445 / CBS 680 / BCRC 21525 / NBRC 1098 / NCYC 1416 / NRRL Y-2227) TaxID=1333698 RepID=A0A8J2T5K4_ZYGB2|nr:CTK2 (YJL006C) [Zygosaccharomyces parabailii]CDF88402.1 BN860_09384g1_1 [Zygosaccharomyces bailii CLIB 213]CDH14716.1 probable CTD kinase subunit beta [Zygosaccharomyces bailii ISA1307]